MDLDAGQKIKPVDGPEGPKYLHIAATHRAAMKQKVRNERAHKGGRKTVKRILDAKGEPVGERGKYDRRKGQPVWDLASSPVIKRRRRREVVGGIRSAVYNIVIVTTRRGASW